MARIRTIKPEFFTSEDIVNLSPLARLLYIALWCEADREGRLSWKPKTFKMRYFPGDSANIEKLCDELRQACLVMVYIVEDHQYAFIPTFHAHQHINPRETKTQLPEPPANVKTTREARDSDATARDSDAQVGREGKGKEGKEDSAEPQSDSTPHPPEPPVVLIPLNDNSEHPISQSMIDEWSLTYPAVNVVQELREMRTWSNANPSQRKTVRGVNAFVVRWLGKEQDKGGKSRDSPNVSSLFAGAR
jgi:hypothetical protein